MHRQSGFTLIEVIIALTIFAVGILAVAAMQGTALRAATTAEQLTQGRAAAKSEAERLLALPFEHDDLRDRDGDGQSGLEDTGFDNSSAGDADYGPSPDQGDFRVYWNVAEDMPRSGAKTLCVIALWRERGQIRRNLLTFNRTDTL